MLRRRDKSLKLTRPARRQQMLRYRAGLDVQSSKRMRMTVAPLICLGVGDKADCEARRARGLHPAIYPYHRVAKVAGPDLDELMTQRGIVISTRLDSRDVIDHEDEDPC